MNRRQAFRSLLAFASASPLFAQSVSTSLPVGADETMSPINLHEFEDMAKQKMNKLAYDFIAGGVEDELTLQANFAAYKHWYLIPRVMVDVSKVDMSLELFGLKLDQPIIIAPSGGKNLVMPDADTVVANAALKMKTVVTSATGTKKLLDDGQPLMWWTNTTGLPNKSAATAYARRVTDGGAKGITITVDNQYQSNRDRNNRNHFDYGYMQTGVPEPGSAQKPRNPGRPAMYQPHTPNMTWEQIEWMRSATEIPVILKGVLAPEDAELAVQRGASGIIVSNHGGRQLDGVIATLDALPDVVQAVNGKVPVLMDGGLRRGGDVLKALSLGAKAVLIGRPPLWGLACYGQPGVERVLWMLGAELKLSMSLAGKPNLDSIDRKLVRRA